MLFFELSLLDLGLISVGLLIWWCCENRAESAVKQIRAARIELQYLRVVMKAEQEVLNPLIERIKQIREHYDYWEPVDGFL